MMDIHAGSVNLGEVFLFLLIPLCFIIQLILCFRVKQLIIRLAPAALFAVITALLFIAALASSGWDGIGYLILAIWFAALLGACLLPWAIYLINKIIKKLSAQNENDFEN